MARRNALFEIEKVKQPALIAALPPHHDPTSPLNASKKRNHDSPIISTTFSTVSTQSGHSIAAAECPWHCAE
jgi:hypothetical protein